MTGKSNNVGGKMRRLRNSCIIKTNRKKTRSQSCVSSGPRDYKGEKKEITGNKWVIARADPNPPKNLRGTVCAREGGRGEIATRAFVHYNGSVSG